MEALGTRSALGIFVFGASSEWVALETGWVERQDGVPWDALVSPLGVDALFEVGFASSRLHVTFIEVCAGAFRCFFVPVGTSSTLVSFGEVRHRVAGFLRRAGLEVAWGSQEDAGGLVEKDASSGAVSAARSVCLGLGARLKACTCRVVAVEGCPGGLGRLAFVSAGEVDALLVKTMRTGVGETFIDIVAHRFVGSPLIPRQFSAVAFDAPEAPWEVLTAHSDRACVCVEALIDVDAL